LLPSNTARVYFVISFLYFKSYIFRTYLTNNRPSYSSYRDPNYIHCTACRLHLKCNVTHAETRFRLSAKRTSPFKSAGALVQSTTGSRGVRISGSNGSNVGYTTFKGSVKSTGYPIHSPVPPSLTLPCVKVCHHISTGLYLKVL
jgi:hypothetical protein